MSEMLKQSRGAALWISALALHDLIGGCDDRPASGRAGARPADARAGAGP